MLYIVDRVHARFSVFHANADEGKENKRIESALHSSPKGHKGLIKAVVVRLPVTGCHSWCGGPGRGGPTESSGVVGTTFVPAENVWLKIFMAAVSPCQLLT